MTIRSGQFVGTDKTVIFIGGDGNADGQGPFVPWSVVSAIGEQLLEALTSAIARQAIAAAKSGVNVDIAQLLGMLETTDFDSVLVPKGSVSLAALAAAMGIVNAGPIRLKDASFTADAADGGYLVDSTAAEVDVTVFRSIINADQQKTFTVTQIAGGNPIVIKDDLGAIKFTMVSGQGLAQVTVIGGSPGTVYAGGAQ